MVNYKSKRAVVSKAPYELYMAFVDMRNFMQFLPEDKKEGVTADYDSIKATVQGFTDAASDPYKPDFQITLDADLNLMMKMLLGSKIQGALDKVVDSLVDLSEGRMPEGVDLSNWK